MNLPNFLIVGAAKAGTTSLFYYLRQHPQIYMPSCKETNFFSFVGKDISFKGPGDDIDINSISITSFEKYCKLFEDTENFLAIGEASPSYMYYPEAAKNIKSYVPDAKIIAILRDPAERAYSNYAHFYKSGRETLNFDESIRVSRKRISNNWQWFWDYTEIGFYYRQLEQYFSHFDNSRIKIVFFEDLKKDPQKLLSELFDFLEVENSYKPNISVKYNTGGKYKSRLFRDTIKKVSTQDNWIKDLSRFFFTHEQRIDIMNRLKNLNTKRDSLLFESRDLLTSLYKEDIKKLELLVDKDLSHWL